MEELELTDPVVIPEQVTAKYHVVALTLSMEAVAAPVDAPGPGEPGLVLIDLKDNNEQPFSHSYHGQEAIDLIKWLNTANFSTNSMQKRILQKLSNDGVLPGTVVGAPDP